MSRILIGLLVLILWGASGYGATYFHGSEVTEKTCIGAFLLIGGLLFWWSGWYACRAPTSSVVLRNTLLGWFVATKVAFGALAIMGSYVLLVVVLQILRPV